MGHSPRAFTARLSRELFGVKAIPFNAHLSEKVERRARCPSLHHLQSGLVSILTDSAAAISTVRLSWPQAA